MFDKIHKSLVGAILKGIYDTNLKKLARWDRFLVLWVKLLSHAI